MVLLRNGSEVEDPRLDRLPTPTSDHIFKYPLTTDNVPANGKAMVGGFNWYSNFDRPQPMTIRGRRYMVIGKGDLGRVRGGHAVCHPAWGVIDPLAWWKYYDQGVEGRCVEFAWTRALSLHNRVRYDITSRAPYHQMQESDHWQGCFLGHGGNANEGTSVDAGGKVMRHMGPVPYQGKGAVLSLEDGQRLAAPCQGISEYRWAHDWETVRKALRMPSWMPGVPFLNSWALSYPHRTILLDEAGDRVLREDGEFGMIVDR